MTAETNAAPGSAPERREETAAGVPAAAAKFSSSASAPRLKPDVAAIRNYIDTIARPGAIVEGRVMTTNRGRKSVASGYYDAEHRPQLAETLARLNREGAATYISMNMLDPQLLGRCANRLENTDTATTDANITRLLWILLDADPLRPKNTSSTAAQFNAARSVATAIVAYLQEHGISCLVGVRSGNGAHVLVRIDFPNDAESRELVRRFSLAIADRFDTAEIKIDRNVFNPARIIKPAGCIANKGDDLPAQPWRLAELAIKPTDTTPTPREIIEAIAGPAETPKTNGRPNGGHASAFDVRDFLTRNGVEFVEDSHEGRGRLKLKACVFNADHVNGEAAVFIGADGALGYKCLHNGCADRHWSDVRALFDGPRAAYRSALPMINTPASHIEILPLPPALPAVPLFDLDLVPRAFRPWVEDTAAAMQVPPEFAAVPAIVAAAGIIGRQVAIMLKRQERWIEACVLWGALIGRPSTSKSPALRPCNRALMRLEALRRKQWEAAVKDAEVDAELADAERKQAKREAARKLSEGDRAGARAALDVASEDKPLPEPRLVVNDVTIEKLGEILNANPRGVIQFRDELSGWLASLDREGREGDRGFWLECWNARGAYTCDRIGRGTIRVEAPAVSIIGGIQPGKLAEYVRGAVRGGFGDDGLLQRFQLAVYPDVRAGWTYIDRAPSEIAEASARAVFDRLDRINPELIGGETLDGIELPFLRFADDAQELFIEWLTALMTRLRAGAEAPHMESHLAKYPALVGRLALVLHLVDHNRGPVGAEALATACDWAEYLEGHARRIYAPAIDGGIGAAHLLLAKRADLPDPFAARDVYRRQWSGLGDRETVASAIDVLREYGHVAEITEETGGRPSLKYTWRVRP